MVVKPFKNVKRVKDTTLLDLIPVLEGDRVLMAMTRRYLYERRGGRPRLHQGSGRGGRYHGLPESGLGGHCPSWRSRRSARRRRRRSGRRRCCSRSTSSSRTRTRMRTHR